MLYLGEIDFDTGRVDVSNMTRAQLSNQCSTNADRYIAFRLRRIDGRFCVQRQWASFGPLDFANVTNNMLVVHVISGDVRAASTVVRSSARCAEFHALVRGNMAGFRRWLRSLVI